MQSFLIHDASIQVKIGKELNFNTTILDTEADSEVSAEMNRS
jgi:hypothetical protein